MGRDISFLSIPEQLALVDKVKNFNEFNQGNDLYKEHDFGTVELNGVSYNWKIDYFDENMQYHSPDKSNPEVTNRVMTIMLAEEYWRKYVAILPWLLSTLIYKIINFISLHSIMIWSSMHLLWNII